MFEEERENRFKDERTCACGLPTRKREEYTNHLVGKTEHTGLYECQCGQTTVVTETLDATRERKVSVETIE